MAELNIMIRSYKRPNALRGYDYFKTAKYVIPESQYAEYVEGKDKSRFIVIPDSEDGSTARKSNWILKNIPRPLVILDDDVDCIMMTEGGDYFKANGRAKQMIRLTPEQGLDVIINAANLAHSWGCPLFGFAVNTDGRNYQQYTPFSLSQPILGPFCGHLEHDLLYDEDMFLKDDYDMSIQALNKYRKILRVNKFCANALHGSDGNSGGTVSMRTMDREKAACEAIERKWGTKIIHYKTDGTYTDLLNGSVHIPINGV